MGEARTAKELINASESRFNYFLRIAEVSEHPEVNLTPRQVSNIVSKGSMIIVKFLNQKGNENAVNRPRLYGAISSQLG